MAAACVYTQVWAIILSHFCHNWGTFILLTWMPSYYSQVLGLDLASSGTLSCLPWATMAVSANVGGWLADAAIARGATITTVRKVRARSPVAALRLGAGGGRLVPLPLRCDDGRRVAGRVREGAGRWTPAWLV